MTKQKPKTYAAMTRDEEDIRQNSMKLYSYLLCIAGKEPNGAGRLFQQKNLVLTKIKKCVGLSDKTIKLYLYELEIAGLVKFKGNVRFETIYESDFNNKTDFRKAKEQEAFRVWKLRDKKEYYYIPRPERFTPIPEITLDKLNTIVEVSEMEMKIYTLCCTFRDLQVEHYGGMNRKICFEDVRDILGIKDTGSGANRAIKKTLYLFRGLGLIDFEMGFYYNTKDAKIECFELKEVNYYINQEEYEWEEKVVIDREIIEESKARIEQLEL